MLFDRVEQTTITTGIGPLSLAPPADASRRSFAEAAGNGGRAWYCAETITETPAGEVYGLQYEYGWGVVTAGLPDTMTRNPILSSNSNGLVNFPSGTKRVYSVLPASVVPRWRNLTTVSLSSPVAVADVSIPSGTKQLRVQGATPGGTGGSATLAYRVSGDGGSSFVSANYSNAAIIQTGTGGTTITGLSGTDPYGLISTVSDVAGFPVGFSMDADLANGITTRSHSSGIASSAMLNVIRSSRNGDVVPNLIRFFLSAGNIPAGSYFTVEALS